MACDHGGTECKERAALSCAVQPERHVQKDGVETTEVVSAFLRELPWAGSADRGLVREADKQGTH
eukprot:7375661-Prymnesium_polylepis.2